MHPSTDVQDHAEFGITQNVQAKLDPTGPTSSIASAATAGIVTSVAKSLRSKAGAQPAPACVGRGLARVYVGLSIPVPSSIAMTAASATRYQMNTVMLCLATNRSNQAIDTYATTKLTPIAARLATSRPPY